MKTCKYICLLLLYFLYVGIFFALCFLLNLPVAVIKTLFVLWCLFLLLIYFWGDRIILAMIKAHKLSRMPVEDHESYRSEVENIACLMGLIRVEIYRAKGLPLDIYVLKGIGNSSCIILGGDTFGDLSQKEINALIYFSILKIKKLNLRFIQGCNFLFFIINLPIIFIKKFKLFKFIGLIMNFFLLPLRAFKGFVFKEDERLLEEVINKLQMRDKSNAIKTTRFKLRYSASRYSGDISRLLLADLAMVERKL